MHNDDIETLWQIVKRDLPPFLAFLNTVILTDSDHTLG